MITEVIEFEDFNGMQRREAHTFNLMKSEVFEWNMGESQLAKDGQVFGGVKERLDRVAEGGNGREIIDAFKDFIFMSYGIKSQDGRRFEKSAEISKEFAETNAFSQLLLDLCTDADKAAAFIRGILPANMFDDEAAKRPSDRPDPNRRPQAPNAQQPVMNVQNTPLAPAQDPRFAVPPSNQVIQQDIPQQNQNVHYMQNPGQQGSQDNPTV